MRISDWSSDVCSSDLIHYKRGAPRLFRPENNAVARHHESHVQAPHGPVAASHVQARLPRRYRRACPPAAHEADTRTGATYRQLLLHRCRMLSPPAPPERRASSDESIGCAAPGGARTPGVHEPTWSVRRWRGGLLG